MPASPSVDFVPECGAYRQRIQKELRSMRPRAVVPPSVGPYAIPHDVPPNPDRRENSSIASNCGSSGSRASLASVKSSSSVNTKLMKLEQQIIAEREERKLVEMQLDRLQQLLLQQQLTSKD